MKLKIDIPKRLTSDSLSKFSCDLNDIAPSGEFIIDFGEQRWFPPFSMLFLSMILRQFRAKHEGSAFRARHVENHGYASHFGFFQSFGLDHGNHPGEADGDLNYIPFQKLNIAQIREEAWEKFKELGDIVEEKSGDLATMLTRTDNGILHDTLTYSIREIIRNVAEHSEAEDVFLCAQYWPKTHRVEVGIADSGVGICSGLSNNPEFSELNNRDALQTALMPGVSGNIMAGRGDSPWQNSGYGLYMTNRVCRNGGSFFIASGDAAIKLHHNSKKTDVPCHLSGTAVRLIIDTRRLDALPAQLSRFADEGRLAAQQVQGANVSFASSASQMLQRDFKIE